MDAPRFLSVENVLRLHGSAIDVEGGGSGMREPGLLESAVMMPQQQFGGAYLHEDIPAMSAAYLYHLCSNHPFVDGNKRVGAMAAYVFLDVNGWEFTAPEQEFEEVVMRVAAGEMEKPVLIEWMRSVTRRGSSK